MTAVLFVSHLINKRYIDRYLKLYNDLKDQYDVYWLFQTGNGISDAVLYEHGINVVEFSLDDLNELQYSPISEHIIPGSVHFIIEHFYHNHPEYDYYWIVEYDVVFTGNWIDFMGAFTHNNADMISSHIEFHNEQNEQWTWWNSLIFSNEDDVSTGNLVKSFNPIYRISNRALHYLDEYMQKGNQGHFEASMSTALYNNGYRLEDFGGTGDFVAQGNQNRFYIQEVGITNGSLRWRPMFQPEDIKSMHQTNKLFHPVK